MNAPITIPFWVFLVCWLGFGALQLGWLFASREQAKALNELFRIYWRNQYGSEFPDAARSPSTSDTPTPGTQEEK